MYNNKLVAAIAINGKTVREQGEKVYIPFGSEYQIFLKNEHSRRVIITIEVDGKNVFESGNKLVLEAGVSHYLSTRQEGGKYYNFKFIEKTTQIELHRGNKPEDGLIRISYQFAREKPAHEYATINPSVTGTGYWNPWWNIGSGCLGGPYYGEGIRSFCNHDTFGGYSSIDEATSKGIDTKISYTSGNPVTLNSVSSNSSININNLSASSARQAAPLSDAGITVNGNKREDVRYDTINVTDEMESFHHVMVIQLLGGFPEIPVTAIKFTRTKIECSSCGTKNSSNNKFCPQCGTGLEL